MSSEDKESKSNSNRPSVLSNYFNSFRQVISDLSTPLPEELDPKFNPGASCG